MAVGHTVSMATLRADRFSDSGVAAWGEHLAGGIARGMQLDDRMLEVVLCTVLAGGHLLLEDRPGVGKTQLARTLAAGQPPYDEVSIPALARPLVPSQLIYSQLSIHKYHKNLFNRRFINR